MWPNNNIAIFDDETNRFQNTCIKLVFLSDIHFDTKLSQLCYQSHLSFGHPYQSRTISKLFSNVMKYPINILISQNLKIYICVPFFQVNAVVHKWNFCSKKSYKNERCIYLQYLMTSACVMGESALLLLRQMIAGSCNALANKICGKRLTTDVQ